MRKFNIYWIVSFCIISIFIGFGLGYILKPIQVISSHSIRENTNEYKFIHPLLAVDRPDGNISPNAQSIYNKVQKFMDSSVSDGKIINSSVYFIDYSGKLGSFGINENEPYSPASLLKVVIMVAYLKQSESNPSILDKEYIYQSNTKNNLEKIPFDDPSMLKDGKTYTVNELINRMIIDSDNGAKNLLIDNLDVNYLMKIYTELNLKTPNSDNSYAISAKEYSLFIRILYNATYLNSENSEKALSILAKAKFVDGLVTV